jgi:hypothetical protein
MSGDAGREQGTQPHPVLSLFASTYHVPLLCLPLPKGEGASPCAMGL